MTWIRQPRIWLFLLAGAALFAGPPYLTDDPEPVGLHRMEVFLFSQGQWTSGARSGFLPALEANFGPFPNAQLQIQIPFVRTDLPEEGRVQGFGDIQMGFKYRFIEEGDVCPQFAFYPQIQMPTASDKDGLGAGHWRVFLPLWMQKSFGPWTTYGGGGWWRNPGLGNRDYSVFGWQVQREFGESGSIGFEVFHQGGTRLGEASTTSYNFGFQKSLTDRLQAVGSAGRMFKGETGYQCYLGLKGYF